MRQTYRDACRVIVWLGISSNPRQREATGRAASFLAERLPPIPDGLSYVEDGEPIYLVREENAAVMHTICQDVLRRPWWWRIWVIQEVALARSIVVLCDGHRFSWEHLVHVSQWIRILDINLLKPVDDGSPDQNPFLPNINFKAMYRYNLVFGGGGDVPVLDVLQNASPCEASDKRDMIYGLLGMVVGLKTCEPSKLFHLYRHYFARDRKLVVDYQRSVAEVYTDFARVHLRTHKKNPLDVITFSRFNPNPEHVLPSWVPDWSNLKESSCFSLANPTVPSALRASVINHYYYRASGTRRAKFSITPDLGLRVKGIRFDSVSRTGTPLLGLPGPTLERVIPDWKALACGEDKSFQDSYLGSNQTLFDVFDRTLTVHTARDGSRVTPEQGYLYTQRAVTESVDPNSAELVVRFRVVQTERGPVAAVSHLALEPRSAPSELVQAAKEAERAVELRAVRRRFFITSKGFFGLGPRNMEEGDVVFVLYGCSVPVVLRPKGKHWSLIGEAFVAGIMDGEVVQATHNPGAEVVEGGIPVSLLKGTEENIEIR